MTKSTGGPITAAGKETSSRNAVKHGATAKQFVNEKEELAYQTFLSELTKHYTSNNPLVKMQIERIAKIKVQLERIQLVINATFEMSKAQGDLDAALMSMLKIDPEKNQLLKSEGKGLPNLDRILNSERIEVAKELINQDIDKLQSAQDFLDHCPKFCQYLYTWSRKERLNLKEFIAIDIDLNLTSNASPSADTLQARIKAKLIKMSPGHNFNDSLSLDESVLKVDPETLATSAKLHAAGLKQLNELDIKTVVFSQIRQLEHLPLKLDFDTLDKLYRYQTTLQRQLSTAVGELLVLTKN